MEEVRDLRRWTEFEDDINNMSQSSATGDTNISITNKSVSKNDRPKKAGGRGGGEEVGRAESHSSILERPRLKNDKENKFGTSWTK